MSSTRGAIARGAGKGGAIVLLAKVYFVVVGFAQQVLLRNVLGLEIYGRLSLALLVVNVVNNVVVSSSTQGTSRIVAGLPEDDDLRGARGALFGVLRIHLPLAAALAAIFLALGWLVVAFEHNPALAMPLRVLTVVVASYAIYAPVIGALNGLRLFRSQAILDVLFATLRTLGLVIGAWAFIHVFGARGEVGAVSGFATAAVLIVPCSLFIFGFGASTRTTFSAKSHLSMLLALGAGQFFSNALMQGDLLLFGRFVHQLPADPALKADEWVGVYRACQTFAFLPYQLLLGVAQILFPLVAKAYAERDTARVRELTERGFRATWLTLGLLVSGLFALRAPLLRIAFGEAAATFGTRPLGVLLFGQAMFALFGVSLSVLASVGKERETALTSAGALALVVGASFAARASATTGGEDLILRTTIAVSLALFASFLVVTLRIIRATGGYVPLKTALRTILAVAIAAGLSALLPTMHPILALVVRSALAFVSYAGILMLSGEVTRDEIRRAVTSIRSRAF